MYLRLIIPVVLSLAFFTGCGLSGSKHRVGKFGMIMHGGAGTMSRESLTPEREAAFRADLELALREGHAILKMGGSSLDAVEKAVTVLEDSPLFNAGKGAVFTAAGANELDASIMDGRDLSAGGVASVTHVKNPVRLARRVMEKTPHVLLVREGAEAFAREQGIELVPESYFRTEHRWKQLERVRAKQSSALADPLAGAEKFGTVGAAALDREGHLAAATSTGGLTNKMYGRVGDSPIVGAGTYADDATGALSGTGKGEYFIRLAACYAVAARMRLTGSTLADAMREVVQVDLRALGEKSGGLIGLDAAGNWHWEFNTPGMFRGVIDDAGKVRIEILGDEE